MNCLHKTKFAGQWILRAIKIRSTTSFTGEVRFYDMLKKAASMKEIHRRQKSWEIFRHVSSSLILGVSAVFARELCWTIQERLGITWGITVGQK
jgi:hypothetical protein